MDHINLIIVSGVLERVSLRFRDDGSPIATGSLRIDELGTTGSTFRTYPPFEDFGRAAEALGEHQVAECPPMPREAVLEALQHQNWRGKKRAGGAGVQVERIALAGCEDRCTGRQGAQRQTGRLRQHWPTLRACGSYAEGIPQWDSSTSSALRGK
jgi:hypothetical protein